MIEQTTNNEMTDRYYWEQYYKGKSLDLDAIETIGKVYDKYWSVCVDEKTKSVLEIGAFPGRYLTYVSNKYNLRPTGLDFQSDLTLIDKTLRAFGINDFDLINEDFLQWKPSTTYDLVLSIGFVEHFENYDEVISKHSEILNKGGALFFQIPNKRYLRKWYGQIADSDNLKAHNLKVMSLDVFKLAASQNNMEIEILEYVGPFQYGLHGDQMNAFRKLSYKAFKFLFKTLKLNNLVEKYPSKFWSASIICVMRKK